MRILLCLTLGLLLSTLTAAAPSAAAPSSVPVADATPADEPPAEAALPFAPTLDDVLALMAKMPATELGPGSEKPYPRWAKTGQANRIAQAIADHAASRRDLGDLVVYEIREAGNRVHALGDGGKSHGPWQLSEDQAKPEVAQDPDRAAVIWLALAKKSRLDCAKLPEDEQLAELASGSCENGRSLARRRARLRDRILADY